MEKYNDKNDMLNAARAAISLGCEQYVPAEIDEDGFKKVLSDIPEQIWLDADASLSMISILVEDEELYDISLQKNKSFAEFICGFIPNVFWKNTDGILRLTELIVDNMISWCSCAAFSDFGDVLQFVSDDVRSERSFILSMIELIAARQNSLEWNGNFEDVIPDSFLNDKDDLLAVVMFIMGANQSNAADFGLVPSSAWKHSEVIFWILSNFQDQYESDRYLFTMYPVFRGSKRDYLESFIQFVPDKFKSDKDFVLEFLEYSYFSEEFDVLYDWMDKELWNDKKVVLKILDNDVTAIINISEELSADEEIQDYIDENIDFEYDLSGVPEENIPQWIKENKK